MTLSFLIVVDDPCTYICLIVYLVQFTYAQQTSANIDKHLGPAELICSWLVWPTLDQILPTQTAIYMNHVIVQVLVSLRA